jgi:hypothetical protein
MPFRFVRVLTLLAVLAGTFAGIAKALDFDDEDPEPPHPEIGLVYHYELGTHAGACRTTSSSSPASCLPASS